MSVALPAIDARPADSALNAGPYNEGVWRHCLATSENRGSCGVIGGNPEVRVGVVALDDPADHGVRPQVTRLPRRLQDRHHHQSERRPEHHRHGQRAPQPADGGEDHEQPEREREQTGAEGRRNTGAADEHDGGTDHRHRQQPQNRDPFPASDHVMDGRSHDVVATFTPGPRSGGTCPGPAAHMEPRRQLDRFGHHVEPVDGNEMLAVAFVQELAGESVQGDDQAEIGERSRDSRTALIVPRPASATSTTRSGATQSCEVDVVAVGAIGERGPPTPSTSPTSVPAVQTISPARSAVVNEGRPSSVAAIGGAHASG